MTKVDAKHFQVAAELEKSIHRAGRLVGQTWPWLHMASALVPDAAIHDPLLSIARSAFQALQRDGLRLDSPLIGPVSDEDRATVLEWCQRHRRQPNDHWDSMAMMVLTDQYLCLQAVFRRTDFLTDSGSLSDEQKRAVLPSLFTAADYDRPQILQVIPL